MSPAAKRTQSAGFVAATIFVASAACESAIPVIHTIHTDSAGISIATAVEPLWGPGEGWTVENEPIVEIGTVSGPPEYQFTDVVAVVRLTNGDIVVADRGASELRSYDASGGFQWHTGRSGEGPGEFASLDFLGITDGDTLVAYDADLMRAQVFDAQGNLARVLRVTISEDGAARESAVADKAVGVVDGLLLVRFSEYGGEIPTGIVRWPRERLAAVDLGDGTARSLLELPGAEAQVGGLEGGGYSHGAYVFAKGPEYATAAGHVAVIDTEAWLVQLISPQDGSVRAVFRRKVALREATAALFDLHLDGVMKAAFADQQAPPEAVDALRRSWRARPRAPTLPVLRAIHLDITGHVWVQPYYLAGAEPPPFEIHAPDGTWLGGVSVPPGLARGFNQYQAPYLAIGRDYILGVWADDLDVQYVRMYRINN